MAPLVAAEIDSSANTLVFTNTRSQAEIWHQRLLHLRPDWAGIIAIHHGSLARKVREGVESGLKQGALKAVVCTSMAWIFCPSNACCRSTRRRAWRGCCSARAAAAIRLAAGACLNELKASQIEAEASASPHASPDACSIAEPVRITSIGLRGGGKLDLPARPLLDCSFALAFAGYLRDLVAPLGDAMLGATVVSLDTGPGYYCRDVDRVSGAKINPHGKGIAIDVSAVLLSDRRRIAVGHESTPRETLYMQTIRRAGCGWFTTILGPDDPDHADHFHFDILRHGATDNYRICE
jgi:superfamily II DNA/RNA helicase